MHDNEPRWIATGKVRRDGLPADLASWLLYRKSLTRRIQQMCPGRFAVQVVSQVWQRPFFSEKHALGVPDREICLIRQVRLLCDRQPWVFARTAIPVSTLRGERRRLQHLGNRPLGAMLFADRRIHRHANEIARLTPDHTIYQLAVTGSAGQPPEIWGRRSVYDFSGRRLLVNEIFLPALRHACRDRQEIEPGIVEPVAHAC